MVYPTFYEIMVVLNAFTKSRIGIGNMMFSIHINAITITWTQIVRKSLSPLLSKARLIQVKYSSCTWPSHIFHFRDSLCGCLFIYKKIIQYFENVNSPPHNRDQVTRVLLEKLFSSSGTQINLYSIFSDEL